MLIGLYRSKEELRESVGQPLKFEPTNVLVSEWTPCGCVAIRGPVTEPGCRPWTAEVTLIDGVIRRVD